MYIFYTSTVYADFLAILRDKLLTSTGYGHTAQNEIGDSFASSKSWNSRIKALE